MIKLGISLFGYTALFYLFFLLPFHLYEPIRQFDLPNLLWITHLIFLYIHEAGHFFFMILGHTMYVMGGSLFQIIIPAVWYVVAKRENSSLSNAAIFFTGYSIVDVSVYVKDAGMLQLPLIGGLSKSHHDWATLFNEWELIEYSHGVGEVMFWIGMSIAAYGIYAGIRNSIVRYQLFLRENE
jgi:hypothetical protein